MENDTTQPATRSATIGALAEALSKAQGQMSGAAKANINPHFKSKYADLASVWEACREPLSSNGLSVLQPVRAEGPNVTVTTILAHTSGEWISEALTMTATKNDPQAVGSAITYGRRYGLSSMVGIAPEDDDGNAASAAAAAAAPVMARVPDGYDEWLADLTAEADKGMSALLDKWQKSKQQYRLHLATTNKGAMDILKTIAAKASGAATEKAAKAKAPVTA